MSETTATSEKASRRAGKYLTFVLADEEYGLEILKVREIIGMMDITSVPRTPQFIKGIINLRGKVIPVVDLRLKVGISEAERTDHTCIIVVDVGNLEMGIIVDEVREVLDIPEGDIEDAPSFGAEVDTDFILGMGKADENVTILLDISKLLSQSDIAAIHQDAAPTEPDPSAEPAAQDPTEAEHEETPVETPEHTPTEQE